MTENTNGKANPFFIEMIVVIFFFALSAAVILQVFVGSHQRSLLSRDQNNALMEVQALAEEFKADDDENPLSFLGEDAPVSGETYVLSYDRTWNRTDQAPAYRVSAAGTSDENKAGLLLSVRLRAERADGTLLCELTPQKYLPVK